MFTSIGFRKSWTALSAIVLFIWFSGCQNTRNAYLGEWRQSDVKEVTSDQAPVYTLYLTGDVGAAGSEMPNRVLQQLEKELSQAPENSGMIFLGDQAYPNGLPDKNDPKRNAAEQQLTAQLNILKNFPGQAYFVAGERDWNNGRPGGYQAVKRQEKFLESYFDVEDKVHMYPGKGCADPKVVKIHKDLVLVFIDSQWWLHNWHNEQDINEGCDIESRYDLMSRIQEIFFDHKNDEIVWVMHHPLRSNGVHGGNFGLKEHLFPFQKHNVNIPLPVLGSAVPFMRGVGFNRQDVSNQLYQELIETIEHAARRVGARTIFASAHDQGLQYFDDYKLQYVVSGSGGTTNFTAKGEGATFAQQARGYAKIEFYEEFETWLEFYTVPDSGTPQLAFRTRIRDPRAGTVEEVVTYPAITKADTILPANAGFTAGGFKKIWWGEQYRDEWTTPVKARLIDLDTEQGGLTPIKKGGGMASNSLRMEAENGKQYILRSINKDYRKMVPPNLGNLKLIDIFQDQNSASHPYAAITLPTLSRAAGVYYTTPELVYLQHQPGLDNYNSQFPEELYLLEQRPAGDWSDSEQFGNSEKIIGYADLLVNLREKKSHYVDQNWVCKSRIFDLLIHDFDRHDDQWRWATFESEDSTLYRPIPRDRDQAYYKFKGLIPTYVGAFMVPKFRTMKGDLKATHHQSFNARYFDRYFMNALEWSDWEALIKEMQADVTDEVIDEAMARLPAGIDGSTADITQFLKERRTNLMSISRALYDFISKEVEVTGTDNKDRFEINSNADGSLSVDMYVLRKSKDDVHRFSRTFYPSETKEVRLYGLRGKDEFVFSGTPKGKIRVRIIGGEDEDVINNELGYKVHVYDEKAGITMNGSGFKDKTSNTKLGVNDYNRYGFRYNSVLPLLAGGYTVDDGVWIGASVNWTRHGWRKAPYKSQHSLSATVAPGSREAFQVGYKGHFPNVIGALGFAPEVDVNFPRYENYFGIGNESTNTTENRRFNWVRMQSIAASPLLQLISRNENISFQFGPTFESIEIENTEGRVSDDPVLGFSDAELDRRNYLGGLARFEAESVDNPAWPTNGFRHIVDFKYLNETALNESVTTFSTDAQLYLKITQKPLLVFAQNIGYQKNWGEPQFHQLADLGNRSGLRGFRNERFRGDAAFFHNIDLRIRLLQSNNKIMPIDLGLVGGFDYGRVWLDGEDSDTWHNSQTIGLWIDILGFAILQPYYSFNDEKEQFSFNLGFSF